MSATVTINSKVKVVINGKVQELQIVGSADVDPQAGRVSYLSPVGEAVLGKNIGDNFEVDLPGGKKFSGQILEIII